MPVALILVALVAGCSQPEAVAPRPPVPPPVTCTTVANHLGALYGQTDHGARVHAVVLGRCSEDVWSEPAKACFLKITELHAGRHCRAHLGEARDALDRDLAAASLPPPDTSPDPCERFGQLEARLDGCKELDAEIKAGLHDLIDGNLDEWNLLTPALKARMFPACKRGVDTLVKLGAEKCGW
jgi:hypothetical protein